MIQLTHDEQYAKEQCESKIQLIAHKSHYLVCCKQSNGLGSYIVAVEITVPIPHPVIRKLFNDYREAHIFLDGLATAFCLDYPTIYGWR